MNERALRQAIAQAEATGKSEVSAALLYLLGTGVEAGLVILEVKLAEYLVSIGHPHWGTFFYVCSILEGIGGATKGVLCIANAVDGAMELAKAKKLRKELERMTMGEFVKIAERNQGNPSDIVDAVFNVHTITA